MARGAVCRADLLRQLAVATPPRVTLDQADGSWFGYVAQVPTEPREKTRKPDPTPSSAPTATPGASRDGPLQWPHMVMVVERQTRVRAREPSTYVPSTEPLGDAELKPLNPERQISYEHLLPQARLLPALKMLLSEDHPGALDMNGIVGALAERRLPSRLPRQTIRRWPSRLIVVLDFSVRLKPYQWDMHQLAQRLQKLLPATQLSLRTVRDDPASGWKDWAAWQTPLLGDPSRLAVQPWRLSGEGTPLLVVSDLGATAEAATRRAWSAFFRRTTRAGLRVLALAPVGADQLSADIAPRVPVVRWNTDGPLRDTRRRVSGPGSAARGNPALDQLLGRLALAQRVDPPLLRALRKIGGGGANDAGLEAQVWAHADVRVEPGGRRARVAPEAAHRYRETLSQNDVKATRALLYEHHQHLRASLNHEEVLNAACVAPDLFEQGDLLEARRAAQTYLKRLCASIAQGGRRGDAFAWQCANDLLERAGEDRKFWFAYEQELTAIHHEMASHGYQTRAGLLDPALLAELRNDRSKTEVNLVLDVPTRCVRLQREEAGPLQQPLGDPFVMDAGEISVRDAGASRAAAIGQEDLPATLIAGMDLERSRSATVRKLRASTEDLTLATVPRPARGVASWETNSATAWSSPASRSATRWPCGAKAPGLSAPCITKTPAFTARAGDCAAPSSTSTRRWRRVRARRAGTAAALRLVWTPSSGCTRSCA